MYLFLIFPFIFSIILIFVFSSNLGKFGSIFVILSNLILSWFSALVICYETLYNNYSSIIKVFNWISLGVLHIDVGFLFDQVSSVMVLIILTISLLVHIYSIDYMRNDPFFIRFYLYLTIFTFFMILFVLSDNFLQMFFGWEGVGLTSYLLINFWYTRLEANKSAIKAIFVNRIGDVAIYFALMFIYFIFQTFSYYTIFELNYWISSEFFFFQVFFFSIKIKKLTLVAFLLFLGAMSKSAQIGFHTWLPDAMEGPTPVSALLHAATMVTAGVFLLIRISPFLEFSSDLLLFISVIGGLTAFFTATIGIFQLDLKKVIAYSTCSQLGYMISVCGFSGFSVALFHLFNHAFFKALLFLGAGMIIHALNNEQDMRKMGSLVLLLPITYCSMLIASCSLSGFPFLSGFFSKDLILEISYNSFLFNGLFVFWLGTFGAFCTVFYSIRLLYLVFWRKNNGFYIFFSNNNVGESMWYILIIFFFLSILSIFSGYFFFDLFAGPGNAVVWGNSFFSFSLTQTNFDYEYIPLLFKLVPIYFTFFAFFIAFLLFTYYRFFLHYFHWFFFNQKMVSFFYYKWYFDYFYQKIILVCLLFFYSVFLKGSDRGFIEFYGPIGIGRFTNVLVNNVKNFYTASINFYTFFMFNFFGFFLVNYYFYYSQFIFYIQFFWDYLFSNLNLLNIFFIFYFIFYLFFKKQIHIKMHFFYTLLYIPIWILIFVVQSQKVWGAKYLFIFCSLGFISGIFFRLLQVYWGWHY